MKRSRFEIVPKVKHFRASIDEMPMLTQRISKISIQNEAFLLYYKSSLVKNLEMLYLKVLRGKYMRLLFQKLIKEKYNYDIEIQIKQEKIHSFISIQVIPPENTFYIDFNGQHHLCFIEQGHLLYQHKDQKQRSKMNTILGLGEFLCVKEFIVEDPDMELFKAVGYVSLLVLSKQDFLLTLKDYPDDFQKYCQLKDSIVMNVDQEILQKSVYCPACQQFGHTLTFCPFIQHKPNYEVTIKKHQLSKNQQRSQFQRKRKKNVFLALYEKDLLAEFAKAYSYDNQQSITQQLKIFYYNEQDQTDYNMMIDPSASVDIFKVSSLLPQYPPETQTKQIDLLSSVRMDQKPIKESEVDIKGELRQQLNQGRLIRKTTMFPPNNNKQIRKSPTNTFTIKQVLSKQKQNLFVGISEKKLFF